MKKISLILASAAVCLCAGSWQLRGQTTSDVSATIQFSNGETVSITDFSNSTTVGSNELIKITIHFASTDIGEIFKVEAPDGGSISLGNNVVVVGDKQTISFAFHASSGSGQNSINIQSGSRSFSLRFSVVDSSGS
jgi:hypothetical protein